jgi:hypothetical protein
MCSDSSFSAKFGYTLVTCKSRGYVLKLKHLNYCGEGQFAMESLMTRKGNFDLIFRVITHSLTTFRKSNVSGIFIIR